jgi:hypothetical protein
LGQNSKDKKTCFIIGPIGSAGTETRLAADFLLNGVIRPAIEDFLKLKLWRADEDNNPGMITDKLINDIYDCDLVIADLTELNPNAFYELGIRHAAAKPTIHIAAIGTKLPFDNIGHRAIFYDRTDWGSIETARTSLRNQCEEALAENFQVNNPVTQALTIKAFRASAQPTEKTIASLMERIESLENNRNIIISNEGIVKNQTSDLWTRDREYKLTSLIRNLLLSPQNDKYDIDYNRITDYSRKNSDETNYRRVMDLAKSGRIDEMLTEISKTI